ncbi:M24 family metallopeptidase [Amycolatopsis aidingensis]|uniref:M24 family metallopeptidase n=1 Tax=Amycolatopsis aidingensis TaxID=2842453 RepID=UPI001C0AD12D|nr:Xaa-Pro peptidase family protein [Amycolatopsis aidingensis]
MTLANIERLALRMDELGVDGLVATSLPNVCYLTGITSLSLSLGAPAAQCYAVVTRDRLAQPHFVAARGELDQAMDALPRLASARGFGYFYREYPAGAELSEDERLLWQAESAPAFAAAPADALAQALRAAGLGAARVAIDEHGAAAGLTATLAEALPAAEFRPGADIFGWARKVKTPEEIRRLAASAALTERGIEAATAIVGPGVTERDLVREFDRTVAGEGGRPRFTLIKFGRSAVAGQTAPGTRPLRRGEAIWFDVGCVLEGYWSDLSRVFSWGEPADKLVRYHAAMLAGQEHALREARPGMPGKEVFQRTVQTVRESGVPHYRRQNVGHGIGAGLYDRVGLAPGVEDLLEENTVLNIETPYHEFGFGAVQVEDTFLVGATGNTLLTSLDRGLSVL